MTSDRVQQLAEEVLERLAGTNIRREDARLYSQHTRLRNRQPGLTSWGNQETTARLADAVSLLHAGEVLRENSDNRWRQCFVRSGELLEWLSHPSLNLSLIPVRLLSAAAYDLAGYPARASALLSESEPGNESRVVRSFLQGNIADSLQQIVFFWQSQRTERFANSEARTAIPTLVVTEVIRSLGVACSALRWPDETRLLAALEKLRNAAAMHASDRDQFSWLLAKLVSETTREYTSHSWRNVLAPMAENMTEVGRTAIDRYCRLAFLQGRARAWPSQEEGVRRILSDGSFALCTPTGSGKTSIAEVALLDAISREAESAALLAPLALYVVPSRALAAEVEGKLSRVFNKISARRVVVTGLYGGTDWGPTDAWLTSDDPSVVICTYEKAEALLRFLGPLMISRLNLVIFDEAHAVQFDGDFSSLRQCENRSLRLESLGMRISQMIDRSRCRVIALSAVATGLEESLHRWVSGTQNGTAVTVPYRSTRQLIGRLVIAPSGSLSIHYDILDGKSLQFSRDSEARPYVPNALPKAPLPPAGWTGPEKSLRPSVLWAAIHFAAPDDQQRRHSVLISVTQGITGYAKDFLELLERHWDEETYPALITLLSPQQQVLFEETVSLCEDYFGRHSYEYRLLHHGIAVHHSNMPKSLSRRIVDLVNCQALSVILATSTLSEGINIPVETILIPSLYRVQTRLSASEFRNLAGRAGRPGVATEGRTLVVLPFKRAGRTHDRGNRGYLELLSEIMQVNAASPRSPLTQAIDDVWDQWRASTGNGSSDAFLAWLERVTVQEAAKMIDGASSLDAIDSILLAGIVEHDELSAVSDWEQRVQSLWNASFSAHLSTEEQRSAFLCRGAAVPNLYPQRDSRRRLYKTGLPPSTAYELIERYTEIELVLLQGAEYANWQPAERFQFLVDTVNALGEISRFRIREGQQHWESILKWWLWPSSVQFPAANKLAEWHKYIGSQFSYRCCWGLGSVVGYAHERVNTTELQPTTLDGWDEVGLPWSVFWLKELISWGTLEPVAAFLLGRGLAVTRKQAEQNSVAYYESGFASERLDPLDARSIRNWVETVYPSTSRPEWQLEKRQFLLQSTDSSVANEIKPFRVFPLVTANAVQWADVAGYVLAESAAEIGDALQELTVHTHDFVLQPNARVVVATSYL